MYAHGQFMLMYGGAITYCNYPPIKINQNSLSMRNKVLFVYWKGAGCTLQVWTQLTGGNVEWTQVHEVFFFFFWWAVLKVFVEFVTISLLFYILFFFFGPGACGILVPLPGIKPALSTLEHEILTTGPPGKHLWWTFRPLVNALDHSVFSDLFPPPC